MVSFKILALTVGLLCLCPAAFLLLVWPPPGDNKDRLRRHERQWMDGTWPLHRHRDAC
ncbi:hypothetical protein CTA1_687 [Colletotrichum tanaceti]|uniref:Uncharacterized protein n=1 Tax=Colletotrichum tanaceti TaxID=1306861 RepID=A0A4V6DH52_9PEZI|nr:hypothetical protein CTA1_687 [Colletotrichum tanaceti]